MFRMPQTRTTVVLDDDLIKRAKVIAKVDTTTAAITVALNQLVRHSIAWPSWWRRIRLLMRLRAGR